jgi:hypothetical protein
VALDQGAGELPLHPDDLDAVALELGSVDSPSSKLLALSDQPSEDVLEGFDWERRLPVDGFDGQGRGARGALSRPVSVSARSNRHLSPIVRPGSVSARRAEALIGA